MPENQRYYCERIQEWVSVNEQVGIACNRLSGSGMGCKDPNGLTTCLVYEQTTQNYVTHKDLGIETSWLGKI